MNKLKLIFFHMSIICGIIYIAARVLDWYNPYMDFGGHVSAFSALFALSVLGTGILELHKIYERYMDRKRYGKRLHVHAGV